MTLVDKLLLRNIDYKGTAYDYFPKVYNVYLVAVVACISGMMFGFDISSMSSMQDFGPYKDYFKHPDELTQGGITASMAAGSLLGSVLSPAFSDAFGRRVSLHMCSGLWIVGAVLQTAAQNQAMLFVGRIIAGMGVGFGSSVAPVYTAEVSPPKIRGAVGGLFQLSITVGILVMFLIGYGAVSMDSVASFRVAWAMQLVPGVVLLLCTFLLPESPRWLANRGRWDETTLIVEKVGRSVNVSEEELRLHINEIRERVALDEMARDFGYADLFRAKTQRKILVGMAAQMWQQLCGMNVMMYYIVHVFKMAGFTGNQNLVSSIVQYALNVLMTIPSLFLVDRAGRRPVLIIGGILMFTWLYAVAGILATYSVPRPDGVDGNTTVRIEIPASNRSAAKAVIACSYLFVCSFAPTWGIGIWIYCAEIFNNIERARGSALCTSVNWAFNFALAMFVPTAFKNITWKTYIIFGTFSVVLTIHAYFAFPETKGKTLEEIDEMWDARIPAWQTASYKPELTLMAAPKLSSGSISDATAAAHEKKAAADTPSGSAGSS
ncbi:AaceriAEL042Cp [[Ashbya] aceris (nom. inval.)]|nr:AaceriAEL042Cp [[Ashbya] aceris (nom. inval.)]